MLRRDQQHALQSGGRLLRDRLPGSGGSSDCSRAGAGCRDCRPARNARPATRPSRRQRLSACDGDRLVVQGSPPAKDEDHRLAAIVQPDHEMSGKVHALDHPALAARGVDVEDRQRDRQAFAPIDHMHQVGVLQVVIGDAVALIGEGPGQHLAERGGAVEKAEHRPRRCSRVSAAAFCISARIAARCS